MFHPSTWTWLNFHNYSTVKVLKTRPCNQVERWQNKCSFLEYFANFSNLFASHWITIKFFVFGLVLKVPLWSNSRYQFFYIFQHKRCFLVILANFSLSRTLELMFFGPFISDSLRPPLIFLVPSLDWELEKMTSYSQKYHTGWTYNNNQCRKLHEDMSQSFCYSLCELLC